jgi:hypothetical protein
MQVSFDAERRLSDQYPFGQSVHLPLTERLPPHCPMPQSTPTSYKGMVLEGNYAGE